ncbi:MAG: hypothetical protein ABIF22_02840 [bacterium]
MVEKKRIFLGETKILSVARYLVKGSDPVGIARKHAIDVKRVRYIAIQLRKNGLKLPRFKRNGNLYKFVVNKLKRESKKLLKNIGQK